MATSRALTVGQRSYPIVLPSIRDPRLHVAAVIISIHILGQIGLGFHVTVPQILAAIVTCAVIEVALTFRQTGAFVWPASAMLTGSGVALILRLTGQPAGDPWGTEGWLLFAVVAGLSLLTKYVIQFRGTHIFNPSNVGLVAAFLVLGATRVQPLDFWWGPLDFWLVLAYVIIVVGGTLVTRRLNLLAMALTYWLTLAIGIGLLAASGHCMTADWAFGPVCGVDFWSTIVASPEVLIFLFFMLTDPKTIPAGRVARIVFAMAVGIGSTLLIAPQATEFAAKVGLLASLVVMCAARPLFDRFLPEAKSDADRPLPFVAGLLGRGQGVSLLRSGARLGVGVALVVVLGVGVVVAGSPARGPADGTEVADAVFLDAESRVDPTSLPTVAIDPAVRTWNVERVRAQAQDLALTLAQNLEVENIALRQGDAGMLASVDHGERLTEMEGRLFDAAASGQTTISRHRFDSLFLTTKLLGSQAGLGMAFDARGIRTEETYDAEGDLVSRRESPFAQLFVLRQALGDERWFNVGVVAAP